MRASRFSIAAISVAILALPIAWLLVQADIQIPTIGVLFLLILSPAVVAAKALVTRISHANIRLLVGIFVVLGFLPLSVGIGVASSHVVNTFRLQRFASQIEDYPLPQRTRMVSSSARVGVLTGNGNHCDFLVSILIESSLSLDALRRHYSGMTLRPAIPGGINAGPSWEIVETERTFEVLAIDAGYDGTLDLRCT